VKIIAQACIISTLLVTSVDPSYAQDMMNGHSSRPDTNSPDLVPAMTPVANGILLGSAGILLGGAVGVSLTQGCNWDEFCELRGAFWGASAGWTFGVAAGIHSGNRYQGSFGLTLLTSTLIGGFGAVMAAGGDGSPMVFFLFPPLQVVSTAIVERSGTKPRVKEGQPRVSFGPTPDGRWMVATGFTF